MATTPGTTPVPRPRKPKVAEKPPITNGHAPNGSAEALEALKDRDDPVRRLTRAMEELHSVAKDMNLAPMVVEWQDDAKPTEVDPAKELRQRTIASMLADYEGLRAGPVAVEVAAMAAPADPEAFHVGNLIRPGTTVMLAGPPGAAKSWASRQLALACGAGLESFLDVYPIAKALNVMVVDEDNGPDEEWRRDEALLEHLGLQRQQVTTVRRVSLEGVRLDEPQWQLWLRGQVRLHELDLVILDPISEMHGGKELREDAAFRSMTNFLKRLKVDFPRLATIIVHHTRKMAAGDRVASRGLEDVRGQWGQTPDVIAMMSPLGMGKAKFEVHKRVPHSSLILQQIPEGEKGEGGLKYMADDTTAVSKRADSDARVLNAIDAGADTVELIQKGTGLSQRGVYKVLNRLYEVGLITKRAPFERLEEPMDMLA